MKRMIIAAVVLLSLITSGHLQAKRTINVVITDHLGTPQQLIDQNQEVVWKASYAPFGKATIEVQKVFFNQRFPGQYYDKETGTHYNYYRDYDPSLGRYIQSDSIGILEDYSDPMLQVVMWETDIPLIQGAGGYSMLNHNYGYVGNNPLSFIDPYGLSKSQGDGSATGRGTGNPYKHCKKHPTDPNKIICKDKKTGKKKTVPKPSDWPEDNKGSNSNNSMSCGDGCKAGLVLVGGICVVAFCATNPWACGMIIGGGALGAQ